MSLLSALSSSLSSFSSSLTDVLSILPNRGGGRAPTTSNKIDHDERFEPEPAKDSECRLCVIQITDVYTLENLAHVKTLVEDVRAKSGPNAKVVAMLTGDFLSPYLLSTVDHGYGMMNALSKIPLDYLTWGNHEADIAHDIVCRHVRNFPGIWLNSNMLDHEAMDAQQEYDVIKIKSADGTNTRKVGLCAVLSHDPKLYAHFKKPGAFGGAHITDPWEALTKYEKILKEDEGCDVVLPLQHLYVPDDHKTCRNFDFPVILSGHDHHRVDEVVEGTRLIKPGMNGDFATVLEMSWPDGDFSSRPNVRSRFVRCQDWPADPVCAEENERAYDALIPLRNTELAQVPEKFEPLTSNNSRGSVCTMGKFICTLIRASLNTSRNKQRENAIDTVLLMGGNIRGNADYELGSFFSLEALEAETKSDEVIGVVSMPGSVLAAGVEETHAGDPIPGWMQYSDDIEEVTGPDGKPKVIKVAGKPLDPNRMYRVATKISDLTNGQSPSWTKYFLDHPEALPPKGNYYNIQSELLGYFARNLWFKLWEAISEEIDSRRGMDTSDPECYLRLLDTTGDGTVTVDEIQLALRKMLGISIDKREKTLSKFVLQFADTTNTGKLNVDDFKHFCNTLNSSDEENSSGTDDDEDDVGSASTHSDIEESIGDDIIQVDDSSDDDDDSSGGEEHKIAPEPIQETPFAKMRTMLRAWSSENTMATASDSDSEPLTFVSATRVASP